MRLKKENLRPPSLSRRISLGLNADIPTASANQTIPNWPQPSSLTEREIYILTYAHPWRFNALESCACVKFTRLVKTVLISEAHGDATQNVEWMCCFRITLSVTR